MTKPSTLNFDQEESENNNNNVEEANEIRNYYEKEIKQLEAVIIDLKNQIELTKKTSKNKFQTVGLNFKVSFIGSFKTLKINLFVKQIIN